MSLFGKLKPGKYTNRKGKNYTVDSQGGIHVDVNKLVRSPEFQRQLKGFDSLFKRQTILALHNGEKPPHLVGVGTYTKKSLIIDWTDDWQQELDELNKSIDITYNSLFDIPEEHPPSGVLYTANEIAEQYGSKKES